MGHFRYDITQRGLGVFFFENAKLFFFQHIDIRTAIDATSNAVLAGFFVVERPNFELLAAAAPLFFFWFIGLHVSAYTRCIYASQHRHSV